MDYKILQDLLKPSPLFELTFNSDSSSSSSNSSKNSWIFDDDIDEPLKKKIRPDKELIQTYSDEEFKRYFLITKESFSKLCNEIVIDRSNIRGSQEIPKEKVILMTLIYLSTSATFRIVSEQFDVSPSACFQSAKLVMRLLCENIGFYIKWPGEDECKEISEEFKKRTGLDGIIGVVGTMHVVICHLVVNEKMYLNDKEYHSVRVQAVVDHKGRFRNVHCEPGSLSTYEILQKSDLKGKDFGKYYLVGDEKFKTEWVVTPFVDKEKMSMSVKGFNFKIRMIRGVLIKAFKLLKWRFQRLNRFDNRNVEFVMNCIKVSMILHNICLEYGDEFDVDSVYVESNKEEDLSFHFRRNKIFQELYRE